MAAHPDLPKLLVDQLDDLQPLGRHLILVFREFELEVLDALHREGYDDLTESDLEILCFIGPAGSRAVDVARLAGMTKQGAGKAISSLEARGYVARRDDTRDSRAWLVVFTRKGEAVIGRAIDDIRRIERRYARLVGPKRLHDMKQALQRLLADHQVRKADGTA